MEALGRPRDRAEHVLVGEVRVLQHRVPADARGRHEPASRARPHDRAVVRLHRAELERPSADERQPGSQFVPERARRHARPPLRLRLATGERHDGHAVARQRHPRARADADDAVRADLPRGQRHESHVVHGCLRGRHHLARPRDDRPRRSVRPSGRRGAAERHRGQPRVPGGGARVELLWLRRAVQLEQRVAARGLHLRAGRSAEDRGARQLQPVRGSARLGQRWLHEPELVGRRGGVSVARREQRSSRAGRRSAAESVCRRGERVQPGESDGGDVGEPDQSGPQGSGDAERRGRPRSRAACEPRGAGQLHLHEDDEPARQRDVFGDAARRRVDL